MRRWIALGTVALLAGGLGWLAALRFGPHGAHAPDAASEAAVCPGGAAPLHWKAPMDPTYIRQQPGKSPMGMDLVPVCPAGETSAADGEGVRVDPAVVQRIGVRTASVERRDLSRSVRAVGRVTWDERLVTHVHTKIQGWVEKLHVDYEGQMVERGQTLLEIYSPELVTTQEELLVAQRYRDTTARSDFDDVSAGGDALLRATRRRLELWDVPERDIDRLLETGRVRKTLGLRAPSSGVVTHLMVRDGMEVGPNDNLYTIADLSRVWVLAEVYEHELPWIAPGQQARVELSYLPGASFEAEVTYVSPFLDPATRTARVRLELPNPDQRLKPDMFANVTIEAQPRPDVLAMPAQAVIRSGRRSVAIVSLGDGRFEPRDVELGIDSGDGWVEVRAGVEEREAVVTSGQFLIDSESRLQEAVEKLLAPPGERHEDHAPPSPSTGHEGHDMSGASGHEGHDMPDAPAAGHDHAAHGHGD